MKVVIRSPKKHIQQLQLLAAQQNEPLQLESDPGNSWKHQLEGPLA